MQNEPAGQSFSGDSMRIIQDERRSMDLPARINPFLHCERQLFREPFCILISAAKQYLNICLDG